MKKEILIDGMTCKHCINHVTEALSELDGVTSVAVYLDENLAVIELTEDIGDEKIKHALDEFGYRVRAIK